MADAMTQIVSGLEHSLGPVIMTALGDKEVTEVMVNPDGKIWIDRVGVEEFELAGDLSAWSAKDVILLLAGSLNFEAGVERPIIHGVLPLPGFPRFHGILSPIGAQASFTIRTKAGRVFSLAEYVASGVLDADLCETIKTAIAQRKNILVVGGTGSGKTTFVNGLIHALAELCPNQRLLILEDTEELQSTSKNTVFLKTSDFVTMQMLVKATMRYRPDRILIGEVTDQAALDLLKAWNTGHPGGFSTIHANSAEEGLDRLEELVEEAGKGSKQKLIGRAVDLILFIQRVPGGRQITQAIEVHGYDPVTQTYKTEEIYNVL